MTSYRRWTQYTTETPKHHLTAEDIATNRHRALHGVPIGPIRLVVIAGPRTWHDESALSDRMASLPKDVIVVTGGAEGADQLADRIAIKLGLRSIVIPAEWDKYGRTAGFQRNEVMLDLAPVGLIACCPDTPKSVKHAFYLWAHAASTGTPSCVRSAQRRGIPVSILGETPPAPPSPERSQRLLREQLLSEELVRSAGREVPGLHAEPRPKPIPHRQFRGEHRSKFARYVDDHLTSRQRDALHAHFEDDQWSHERAGDTRHNKDVLTHRRHFAEQLERELFENYRRRIGRNDQAYTFWTAQVPELRDDNQTSWIPERI